MTGDDFVAEASSDALPCVEHYVSKGYNNTGMVNRAAGP